MFSFSILTSIRLFTFWWWFCSTVFNATTLAQKPAGRRPQQQLQPLGDVLLLILDKDKDQKVTMEEVNSQMKILEQLFSGGDEGKEYLEMLLWVKIVVPYLFDLLDSNGDKLLTKEELNYITKFEKSLSKGGSFKNFVRASFEILDSNGDDELSPEEIVAALTSEETLLKIATEFHKLFPLRSTADKLADFVRMIVTSIGGGGDESVWNVDTVKVGIQWLDTDHDGLVQRKEVGKAYNEAGKKFLEVAKIVKSMGPMLALFGGADFSGGGDSGFKMEF